MASLAPLDRVLATLAIALVANACEQSPLPPAQDAPLSAFLVSKPVSVAASEGVTFVALPPGTAPQGVGAVITNAMRSKSVTAYLSSGGFDPVALEGVAGDELTIAVRGIDGVVVMSASLIVPARSKPRVVRTSPPRGKRDVPLNAVAGVVFSEPIDPATVTLSSIHLDGPQGAVAASIRLTDEGTRVELTPTQGLAVGATYTLVVTGAVKNKTGEAVESTSSDFTTMANAAASGMSQLAVSACPVTVNENCGLWLINADGSNPHQISDALGLRDFDGAPAWSPDGLKIAFSSHRHCSAEGRVPSSFFGGECRREIYVMNADGSGITRITDVQKSTGLGSDFPVWSPDGKKLLFIASIVGTSAIFEVNPETHVTQELHTSTEWVWGRPSWAPDGSAFALSGSRWVNSVRVEGGIYVMDADATNPRKITNGEDGFASWSHDGALIAFQRRLPDPNSWHHLFVVTPEGTGERQLTVGSGNPVLLNLTPTWAPDDSRLAFVHSSTPRQLRVVSADGLIVTQLVTTWAHMSLPAWSPVGTVPPP